VYQYSIVAVPVYHYSFNSFFNDPLPFPYAFAGIAESDFKVEFVLSSAYSVGACPRPPQNCKVFFSAQ